MKNLIICVIAAGLLIGCKSNANVEIYTADILDVVDKPMDVFNTPAVISTEMLTQKSCIENGAKFVQFLSKHFDVKDQGNCIKDGYKTKLNVAIDIPLFNYKNNDYIIKGPFAVFVNHIEKDNIAYVALFPYQDAINYLIQDVKNVHVSGINMDDISLTFSVQNDQRNQIEIGVKGAFVNGEPALASKGSSFQNLKVDRRQSIMIQPSDVRTALALRKGEVINIIKLPL